MKAEAKTREVGASVPAYIKTKLDRLDFEYREDCGLQIRLDSDRSIYMCVSEYGKLESVDVPLEDFIRVMKHNMDTFRIMADKRNRLSQTTPCYGTKP